MNQFDSQHTDKILRCIADGVITTDMTGKITYMNSVSEKLTGLKLENAIGQRFTDLVKLKRDDDGKTVVGGGSGELTSDHVAILMTGDKQYSVSYSMTALQDENKHSIGFVIVLHDVTREYDLTRKLKWQVLHDSLTLVKNRRAFEMRLKNLLDGRGKHEDNCLLYMDLDRFKIVNDTAGHQAGDQLLKQVCKEMNANLRPGDTLCRIGGDEFAIILEGCPLERVEEVAMRQVETINTLKFAWEGEVFKIGISIGAVPVGAGLNDMETLVKVADTYCYAAKSQGGGCVKVYNGDDSIISRRNDEINFLRDLQGALEYESFSFDWQLIQPLRNNARYDEIHEFLVRLTLLDGKRVNPAAFIPVAERYGMMIQLDKWVIRHAFMAIRQHATSERQLYNINLSGQTMADEDAVGYIKRELQNSGANPANVCFEITETAVVNSFTNAKKMIQDLRQVGCRFALDDFGTGLSSFAYLKHFKVDMLKIDGEFVRQLCDDEIDQAMVKMVQVAANELGIETVAEWVEDQQTCDELHKMGIDYVQGYFIGKPEPVE